MSSGKADLISHLMRRAGFGSKKSDLCELIGITYEEIVDNLIDPKNSDSVDDALVRRYHPDQSTSHDMSGSGSYWLYRMVCSKKHLRKKMALFWHKKFDTGYAKVNNGKPFTDQTRIFHKFGMGRLDELLLRLSKDPAMIIWLDNQQNHKDSINENFGRELLELFSMGVGNYTEDDVKECARAFTGWTIGNCEYMELRSARDSDWPYGRISWHYEFDAQDHDDGEKEFLGRKGNFNGEDIVEIICEQEATARFIARHIYHFFVADEPPVPQWPYQPPRDPEAINQIVQAYFDSNYDIKSVMKFVFNSDFFKSEDCWYEKVKSPAELVTGVMRLTESVDRPQYEHSSRQLRMQYMGQTLSNPPSVEGWDGGTTWIDTGALVERMNFASEELGKLETPGSKELFSKIVFEGNGEVEADRIIDICLKHLGTINVKDDTRSKLVDYASENGVIRVIDQEIDDLGKEKIAGVVKLIASTPEFQRA